MLFKGRVWISRGHSFSRFHSCTVLFCYVCLFVIKLVQLHWFVCNKTCSTSLDGDFYLDLSFRMREVTQRITTGEIPLEASVSPNRKGLTHGAHRIIRPTEKNEIFIISNLLHHKNYCREISMMPEGLSNPCIVTQCGAYCMPQVLFAFESEQPIGNSATKQLLNCHLAIQEKSVEQSNGNLVTVLSMNCHLLFDQLYQNLKNCNLVTVLSPNCHLAVRVI